MYKSKVTDYMIAYLEKNKIEPEFAARSTGISAEKLRRGYRSPLDADDFLTLCIYLGIRPEEVREALAFSEAKLKKDE